jgi:catechol 2,3-dioxygenase-like lactoylglutathione lyase family enzyme
MFKDAPAFSTYSVNDLNAARRFYNETLGLEVVERDEKGHTLLGLHVADAGPVMLYRKDDHTPASYTVLNFVVRDIEEAVDQLSEKGVRFEKREGAMKTDEKGIARGAGPLTAWFRDPAGNILSVVQP